MATQTAQEIHKLYALSLQMADLAEEILESRRQYRKDFLRSLARSFADEKAGRVRKINSLADLASHALIERFSIFAHSTKSRCMR